ncbi:BatD family protein [Rhizobium tubonense]|uniref:DUF7939 domain-containing protein n=1 Tax=Rhizobium tubonense TaxID=484088 RepID=A0A2W4CEH2_9HYPH|nr:BatD family protein [Rhizobium tubonense]PZM11221.1 hypothetical protein CPY51_20890 [Rhizobium tubonense]
MRLLSIVLSIFGFLFATSAGNAAAQPFARATVTTVGPIIPGQQINLAVDVFAPNFFTSPPQLPLFDIPNAVVTLPEQRGQNMVETIDGVQYSGIRHVYAIVPQAEGNFSLPPAAITFSYADENAAPVRASVTLPATTFSVSGLPGGRQTSPTFAAENLTISQSLDRDPATLKVGETIVRRVTIFAQNTQAMMIPALSFVAPVGASIYQQTPAIADGVKDTDGQSGSSRTSSVTYVVNTTGTLEIPAVSLEWFDTKTHAMQTSSTPAVTVTVAAAPAPSDAIAPTLEDGTPKSAAIANKRNLVIAGLLAAVLLGSVVVLRLLLPRLRNQMERILDARRQTESSYFNALLATLKHDDPAATYRALDSWSRKAGFRILTDWRATIVDAELETQVDALERKLFDRPKTTDEAVDVSKLKGSLKRSRRLARRSRQVVRSRAGMLPDLNP